MNNTFEDALVFKCRSQTLFALYRLSWTTLIDFICFINPIVSSNIC